MTRTDGRPRVCGEVQTPPDYSPALCYPSRETDECDECTRYRKGIAPWPRRMVVIDGSVTPGPCQLKTGRLRAAA
jgi:DTW domain-containing protein YfiP